MTSFYEWQLASLVLVCAAFLVLQRYVFVKPKAISQDSTAQSEVAAGLSRRYLCVYALAMGMLLLRTVQLLEPYTPYEGADWLQGPYIYSVYREQHDLPERLVALLFVLGFLTAGISAPAIGVWADQ